VLNGTNNFFVGLLTLGITSIGGDVILIKMLMWWETDICGNVMLTFGRVRSSGSDKGDGVDKQQLGAGNGGAAVGWGNVGGITENVFGEAR
jgi:hypothetical protein